MPLIPYITQILKCQRQCPRRCETACCHLPDGNQRIATCTYYSSCCTELLACWVFCARLPAMETGLFSQAWCSPWHANLAPVRQNILRFASCLMHSFFFHMNPLACRPFLTLCNATTLHCFHCKQATFGVRFHSQVASEGISDRG
jgi:hypothetical protein